MRVPVTDLVGRPGESRRLSEHLTREDIGEEPWGPADDALIEPIDVDLHLDSVVEGIFVHGVVTFGLELVCSRCLEPQTTRREVAVSELFQDPRKLDPGEEIEAGYGVSEDLTAIDLERMLHDVVVLELPLRIRCDRPACEPPQREGIDLRTEDEHAAAEAAAPDPRWEKLAELDVPQDQ